MAMPSNETTVTAPDSGDSVPCFLGDVFDLLTHTHISRDANQIEDVLQILQHSDLWRRFAELRSGQLAEFEKKVIDGDHIELCFDLLHRKSVDEANWHSTMDLLKLLLKTFKATGPRMHQLLLGAMDKWAAALQINLMILHNQVLRSKILGDEMDFYRNEQSKLAEYLDLAEQIRSQCPEKAKEEMLKKESELVHFEPLWEKLSECLTLLGPSPRQSTEDLISLVDSFLRMTAPPKLLFSSIPEEMEKQLAHINKLEGSGGGEEEEADGADKSLSSEKKIARLVTFIDAHRIVLRRMLNLYNENLFRTGFSVLLHIGQVVDFSAKEHFWRQKLKDYRSNSTYMPVYELHIRRSTVFEDSFRVLERIPLDTWRRRFYITFTGEIGQDGGGLLREWYHIIAREIFNPNYALFIISEDGITYRINPTSYCNSNHLNYFTFIGRWMAKALLDRQHLDCHFTRSLYRHILGKSVHYSDMEKEDIALYRGLVSMLEHNVSEMVTEMNFAFEVDDFGTIRTIELVPNGSAIAVTEKNKHRYVRLLCQAKMTGLIRAQLNAFLKGFYSLIPRQLISIFSESELELLICGLPTINIDSLREHTAFKGGYTNTSPEIDWLFKALNAFDQTQRAKFLQFVTGTSKVPLSGFSPNWHITVHRDDRSTDYLPSAHTCFNELVLPAYTSYEQLHKMVLKAIEEASEGFGFA